MFSGKTEFLIDAVETRLRDGEEVIVLKPIIDVRYNEKMVTSHLGRTLAAQPIPLNVPTNILQMAEATSGLPLVAIDEAQFFGPWLVHEVLKLLSFGSDVLISGLDLTFKGEPFGCTADLLCLADVVHKLWAHCGRCGQPATRSYRKVQAEDQVLVGGYEAYEPRCLRCFASLLELTIR